MTSFVFKTVFPTGGPYNWSQSSNWNPSGPPGLNDDASLAAGGTNDTTYTSIDDIANLQLSQLTVSDAGVTLDIASGSVLTVLNGISNAGIIDVAGTLTGNPTLTNSGTLIVTGTFSVSNINSNTGLIDASGGIVTISNVNTGTYQINSGGQMHITQNINGGIMVFDLEGGLLDITAGSPGQASVTFAGADAGHLSITTQVYNNANPTINALTHMGLGNSIEFSDQNITNVAYNSGTNVLTVTANSQTYTFSNITYDIANPDFIMVTTHSPARSQQRSCVFCAAPALAPPTATGPSNCCSSATRF